MKNHELYIKLKDATEGYTIAQVDSLTITEILGLLKTLVAVTCTFVKNMRGTLAREMQGEQNVLDRAKVKETLDKSFPDWKSTPVGKDLDDKLTVKPAEEPE